jgi:hypothetical protein
VVKDSGIIVYHAYQRGNDTPRNIRLLQTDGTEYVPKTVDVGATRSFREYTYRDYQVETKLIRDVNLKITAFLEEVPPEVESFRAIQAPILLTYQHNGEDRSEFIPIKLVGDFRITE